MSTKAILHRFDSIGDFVAASKKNARKHESSHKRNDGWSGTDTYDLAVRHALRGDWNPGYLEEFRNIFDGLEAKLRKFTTNEFTPARDVSGYGVNMQAYLDGDPDCMMEFWPDEHMVTKRALCIIIGHSISAGCSAEDLFVRGQAAIALVRALSLLGYELEIWSEESVSSWGNRGEFSTLVRLHAAGEIMDESAVEFAIGNPAWLRRLLFGFQEGQSDEIRNTFGFGNGGYGSVVPIRHAETVGADVQLDLGRSWFGGWRKEDRAANGMQWVLDQLKDLGVVDQDATLED